MSFIGNFFTPPHDYGHGKLAGAAAFSFAFAALMLLAGLDPNAGIPGTSELQEARGRVENIRAQKNSVKFRFAGRAEEFEYLTIGSGYSTVKSALLTAGQRQVSVMFVPEPGTAGPGHDTRYEVWQLSIEGNIVRSFADISESRRLNNNVGMGIFVMLFSFGLYAAFLAIRAWRSRVFR